MKLGHLREPRQGGSFERSLGRLEKAYPNARRDILDGLTALVGLYVPSPPNAVLVPGIGCKILKIRLRSTDMQSGKRGGFRVLLVHIAESDWRAILAYAKVERDNVSRAEILAAAQEGREE